MDVTPNSADLLTHFDRVYTGQPHAARHCVRTRGVGWVLQWAAAVAMLLFAGSVLMEFAYTMRAEHTLMRAAKAGALEATLPRASRESIAAAVKRPLIAYPALAKQLNLTIENNRRMLRGAFPPGAGDRLSVTLATSTHAVIPGWLRRLRFWASDEPLEIRIEREMPGRFLRKRRAL
jgi:hypothetical protein